MEFRRGKKLVNAMQMLCVTTALTLLLTQPLSLWRRGDIEAAVAVP